MVVQYLRNNALKVPQLLQVFFKMPSYSQRFFVFVCSLVYLTGTVITQDQVEMTTVLGASATFTCTVDVTLQAFWRDVTNDLTIFSMDLQRQPVKTQQAQADDKYLYYNASLVDSTQFNLVITSVNVTDGGVLECIEQPLNSLLRGYTITVEAEVDPVAIDCTSPCNNFTDGTMQVVETTNCQCTCKGNGGYPNSLMLEWNKGSPGSQITEETSSGPYGTYDFSRSVSFTPERNYSPLICQLEGYTHESITGSTDIRSEVLFNVLYAPACTLEVKTIEIKDSCSVELTCSCEGNPEISENGYKYFMDTSPIEGSTSTIQVTVPLEPAEEVTFTCSGSNSVGDGHQSAEQPYTCTKGVNAAAVAGGVVGGVAVVVLVIVIVYIVKKRGFCEKCTDEKNAVTATTGDTSSAPVYGVIDKSKKKKSDKTDGNGMQMSDAPEYAAVSKPLNSEPKPAPRSSQPPPTNSTEKQELQYADIDHSNRTPSNQIRQPAEAPTEYATVKSVIV